MVRPEFLHLADEAVLFGVGGVGAVARCLPVDGEDVAGLFGGLADEVLGLGREVARPEEVVEADDAAGVTGPLRLRAQLRIDVRTALGGLDEDEGHAFGVVRG